MSKLLWKRIRQALIIIFVLAIMVVGVCGCLLTSEIGKSSETINGQDGNMTLIGTSEDIQVWKMQDGLIICYITVNASKYEAAGIFCK